MRLGKRAFLWSALASLALVAAACSDVSSSSTAAGGGTVPDNSGTTVNFSISPWDGSAANVAVAEYLLKNQRGLIDAAVGVHRQDGGRDQAVEIERHLRLRCTRGDGSGNRFLSYPSRRWTCTPTVGLP